VLKWRSSEQDKADGFGAWGLHLEVVGDKVRVRVGNGWLVAGTAWVVAFFLAPSAVFVGSCVAYVLWWTLSDR
jgi:hypothetical protein